MGHHYPLHIYSTDLIKPPLSVRYPAGEENHPKTNWLQIIITVAYSEGLMHMARQDNAHLAPSSSVASDQTSLLCELLVFSAFIVHRTNRSTSLPASLQHAPRAGKACTPRVMTSELRHHRIREREKAPLNADRQLCLARRSMACWRQARVSFCK